MIDSCRRARGLSLASAPMGTLQDEAERRGLSLLTLDTGTGSDAERLYARLGFNRASVIPRYALMPDGVPCDTTVFWKTVG